METHLADFIRDTPAGREAEGILRKCVHCGFCTATCPTYQLFGDELDGPRGRIYLIKQMLEGAAVTEKTQLHLDRCLSCRSCESTCPSGVRYSRLLDIGRSVLEERVPRRPVETLTRTALKQLLPRRWLFSPAYRLGQYFRPLLSSALKAKVLRYRSPGRKVAGTHARSMIALAGCVQPAMAPSINAATARVLDRLGIRMIEAERAGCCGALRLHLGDEAAAKDDARRNIDAWWPLIDAGAEAILFTASGCGTQLLDYAHLLQDDRAYALKAARVVLLARDISEVVSAERDSLLALLAKHPSGGNGAQIAFHSPCSLQHGLKIRGSVEALLGAAGFTLTAVADAHLCCGSAGAYSVLQPAIGTQLRDNKLSALSAGEPVAIATANIGCLAHLQSGTRLPVRHWIELLDGRLNSPG
ncbi:MAG: glycolate oxidase subunit GlcF [Proteobacteria bacterium]|nr:glycolate oxidase subunit GlcF [Pseudomonadota bacterium]